MSIVTIVGAGMMGSALAFPSRENGHEVRLVGTHLDREIIDTARRTNRHPKFVADFPDGVKFYQIEELESALSNADLVIGGVSSFGVDWFGEKVLPVVKESTPILSVTKGLMDEGEELVCYPRLWQRRLAEKGMVRNICAVGGPCTSYELVAHDQTEVYFCGDDPDTLRFIKRTMETAYYHISLSTDVEGVEGAVALKNGYALGITLTVGLNQRDFGLDSELHYNSQAAVFAQGVREMKKLIVMLGGREDKIIVGAGDLYVTVYGGRTRQAGILMGRGLSLDEAKAELKGVTLESIVVAERVARAVRARAEKGKVDLGEFPLLMHVDGVLSGKPADLPWEAFTEEDL